MFIEYIEKYHILLARKLLSVKVVVFLEQRIFNLK